MGVKKDCGGQSKPEAGEEVKMRRKNASCEFGGRMKTRYICGTFKTSSYDDRNTCGVLKERVYEFNKLT